MSTKSTSAFFDNPTTIDHFLNAIRGDASFTGIGSMQRSDLVPLLVQAIKYGLSCESGIPIEIQLNKDTLNVYAKRLIQRNPHDFDEISEERAADLTQVIEDGESFALEYLANLVISDLCNLQQTTVANISRKLNQMIRLTEKKKEYEIFEHKQNQLIEGTVVRFEIGSPILDLGGYEALLPKTELIPGEFINIGDKIPAYIREVRMADDNANQYQILLNRSSPEFVMKLIEANVPEVASGAIKIKGCARRAGRLSKVSLASIDSFTDPVWPCIGKGGARLKHIRSLMSQEGLHIIRWSDSAAEYICNALYPLEATKIIFESDNEVEVVLPEDSFNAALARDRIQVKLAASLTKHRIKIISESQEIERNRQQKTEEIKMLQEIGLDEKTINALAEYGLTSVESLMECSDSELSSVLPEVNIEGLRADVTKALQQKQINEYTEKGIDIDLLDMPVSIDASILLEYGVKTRQDLSQLGTQMIINMLRKQLYSSDINHFELPSLAEDIEAWVEDR